MSNEVRYLIFAGNLLLSAFVVTVFAGIVARIWMAIRHAGCFGVHQQDISDKDVARLMWSIGIIIMLITAIQCIVSLRMIHLLQNN